MARAPFAADANVADAAPVQLRGGFTPTDGGQGVVEAVAQAAKTGGELVRQNFEKNIQEDIEEQTQSLELALTARAFPKFAKQLLAERAKDDPVVQGAMREMADIASAIKQGVLPHQFANQRLSVIQANAIEAAPEFADEIRAAVADTTGRDPDRAFFNELLSPAKPNLTPEEKGQRAAREQLAKESALTGIPVEDLIILGGQNRRLEAEKQAADAELRAGKRVSINLKTSARNAVNLMTQDLYRDMLQQIQTGGTVDVETTIGAYNAAVDAQIAQLTNALPEGVDPDAAKDTVTFLNQQRDRMIAQLNDNSMVNLITEHKDLMVKGMQLGILQSSPDLALAMALNPSDATRGLDLIVKMGESEFGRKLSGQLSTTAKFINESRDGATKAYQFYLNVVTKGQVPAPQPATQQERNVDILMTREAMKSDDPTVQSHALQAMTNRYGEDFSWAALGNRDVFLASAKNAQAVAGAVEGLFSSQRGGLQQDFAAIVNNPAFDLSKLKFQGQQLIWDSGLPRGEVRRRARIPNADEDIQQFVRDYNEVARIAKMYTDGGILNASQFAGTQAFFDTVTADTVAALSEQEAQRARGAQQQTVITFEDDENGQPRIVGQ